jgi:hypothetical protein
MYYMRDSRQSGAQVNRVVYRYHIHDEIDLDEVEVELMHAIFAAENLFGIGRTRMEAAYFFDKEQHTLVVDGTTEVGQTVNQLLTGALVRGYVPDGFTVKRVERDQVSALNATNTQAS